MAGETWKSHQMTTRERDARMDHAQQLDDAADIHDDWMFGAEGAETADLEEAPEMRECSIYRPDGSFFIGWMHVQDIAHQMATAEPGTEIRVLPAAA